MHHSRLSTAQPSPPSLPPLAAPRLFATQLNPRSEYLVVVLSTIATDGTERLEGLGECSDGGSRGQLAALLGQLSGQVDLADAEAVWAWANDGGGELARRTIASAVVAAGEDLRARHRAIPLAQWLSRPQSAAAERPTGAVTCYANINRAAVDRGPRAFAELAAKAVAQGYSAVKLAPFDALDGSTRAEQGLACVRAVRERVGNTVDVMVDVHERLSSREVLRIAPGLRELRLRWLEDAAPTTDLIALRRIKNAVGTRLAGGERMAETDEVIEAVRAGLLDVVMPDVKHAGGAARVLAMSEQLHEIGVEVSLHSPTGPIATATSAQVLAAFGAGTLEVMYGEHGDRGGLVLPNETAGPTSGGWVTAGGAGLGLRLHRERWYPVPIPGCDGAGSKLGAATTPQVSP